MKKYTPREIELISRSLEEIRKEEERALKDARRGLGGKDTINIGDM